MLKDQRTANSVAYAATRMSRGKSMVTNFRSKSFYFFIFAEITVRDILNERSQSNKLKLEPLLNTAMQNIRGGRHFLRRKRNDVLATIARFGPPTIFLTLSPAEYE